MKNPKLIWKYFVSVMFPLYFVFDYYNRFVCICSFSPSLFFNSSKVFVCVLLFHQFFVESSNVSLNRHTCKHTTSHDYSYFSSSKHCKAHSPETWITCLRLLFRNFQNRNRCGVSVCVRFTELYAGIDPQPNQTKKKHTHTQTKWKKKKQIQTRCLRCRLFWQCFLRDFAYIYYFSTTQWVSTIEWKQWKTAATAAIAVVMAMLTIKAMRQKYQCITHIQK